MRIVSWNMRSARPDRIEAWSYLLEFNPDIAILQDVVDIPLQVATKYTSREAFAVRQNGQRQRFKTVLLTQGNFGEQMELPAAEPWIAEEFQRYAGNLLVYPVDTGLGHRLNVVNVYNPAWPINKGRLEGIDTQTVRLSQQRRYIWLSDLLWSSLNELIKMSSDPFVIAGDFNLCESFDKWSGGPHGNREYLKRMASVGLVECLRHYTGQLTPTFKRPGGDQATCQIDHMFISESLVGGIRAATVGSEGRVFGGNLSDHLPIVVDFNTA